MEVSLVGAISKEEIKRKRDDGSELNVTAFFLTEAKGNKVMLPGARVNEGGKVLDSFDLAKLVGKEVTLKGRGYVAQIREGSNETRVVRVVAIQDVQEKK